MESCGSCRFYPNRCDARAILYLMTRRQALSLLALSALPGRAQQRVAAWHLAESGRSRSASPPACPSTRTSSTWRRQAGLRAPVIYGDVGITPTTSSKSMGCGVAFLDYDNDGWLDIVVLTGRRCEEHAAGAIIRLYRNNRDGTFTDVTGKSGLGRSVLGHRHHRRRLRQRRLRRHLHHLLGPEPAVPQQRRRHLHRRHRESRPDSSRQPLRHRLHLDRLRPRRPARSLRLALPGLRSDKIAAARQRSRLQLSRRAGLLRAARTAAGTPAASTTTTATAPSPTSARSPALPPCKPGYALTAVAADFDGDGWPDIYVACDTSPSLLFPQQPRRHVHRAGPGERRRR